MVLFASSFLLSLFWDPMCASITLHLVKVLYVDVRLFHVINYYLFLFLGGLCNMPMISQPLVTWSLKHGHNFKTPCYKDFET
jgi:hypothetical protein